jgi:hypothetical protein
MSGGPLFRSASPIFLEINQLFLRKIDLHNEKYISPAMHADSLNKPCRVSGQEQQVLREGVKMPKDSQPDNKSARREKARGQTPLTRENRNQNKNEKKQSVKNSDV